MGRRLSHCLALLYLCAGPLYADGHPVTMWKVEGESNAVYILGSIHLLRAEDHPLPGVIDAAYDDADIIVMELDMDDIDPLQTQAAFNRAGVMTDGTTLRDLLGEDIYAEAEARAAVVDIPLDMLAQSEPWLAAMTIELMLLYRIGFDPMLGVEMTMATRAAADGKPIEGLETVDEQLSFLDELPLEAQREMLLQTLQQGAAMDESIDIIIAAWRHGDTAKLESELLVSLEEQTALNNALITRRNRRWAERIAELLDDEPDYLVVVGALHLVGSRGVPALLSEQGHAIDQMSTEGGRK